MATKKKRSRPVQLRPKKGPDRTQAQLLKTANKYVSAQAQSPQGQQLATQATALGAAIKAVNDRQLAHEQALATAAKAHDDVTAAETDLASAIDDYAHGAAKVAKSDVGVMGSLGVDAAATRHAPRGTGPAGVPGNVRVLPGSDTGSALTRWGRPAGAAAFIIQYMLEPTTPPAASAAPAQWLPADGFLTKNVEWTIAGLPPAAGLRGRVRAIGAEVGPWSDEVLGKAR